MTEFVDNIALSRALHKIKTYVDDKIGNTTTEWVSPTATTNEYVGEEALREAAIKIKAYVDSFVKTGVEGTLHDNEGTRSKTINLTDSYTSEEYPAVSGVTVKIIVNTLKVGSTITPCTGEILITLNSTPYGNSTRVKSSFELSASLG